MINFSKAFRQVQICLNAQAKSTKNSNRKVQDNQGFGPRYIFESFNRSALVAPFCSGSHYLTTSLSKS